MKTIFATLCLLLALPSFGDDLTNLRGTLSRFKADEPLRAMLERQLYTESKDDEDGSTEQGKATVEVEDGAGGLRLTYPKNLLAVADQEQRARKLDSEKKTPTRSALDSIKPLEVAEMVDAAVPLLRRLEGAQLEKVQNVVWQGKPARLLTIKINFSLSKKDKKRIKKMDGKLSVWLGADGVPLASEYRGSFKASFLLLSFESTQLENRVYVQRGDRLVAVRDHSEESGSGVGQKFKQRSTTTLTLR